MTRNDLINRLLALPGAILDAEEALLTASEQAQNAKNAVTATIAALYVQELITGKNKETRDAQEFDATVQVRGALAEKEHALAVKRAHLGYLRDEFAALRSVAALLATEA